MADSLRPWLVEYLINIGEQFGANLSNAPRHEKKKKVQLVEFLTYGLASQDDCLWARISDKCYKIPVRFSRTAVAEYSRLNSKRLTEHKTAVVSIKDFRPFFGRVPLPQANGMSDNAHLALEIDGVSAIGSFGEAPWGDPQDVESNNDLREWSEGLRQHGGSGNILMERKKQKPDTVDPDSDRKRALLAPAPKKRNGKVPDGARTIPISVTENVGLLKKYERSWRAIGDPALYASGLECAKAATSKTGVGPSAAARAPSANVSASEALPRKPLSVDTSTRPNLGKRAGSHALDLGSTPPAPTPPSPNSLPDQERQTTPALEEWPASQNVVTLQSAASLPASGNVKTEDDIVLPNSFDYGLPTPVQRPSPRIEDAFPSPPASSPVYPPHSPSFPPVSAPSPVSSPAAQPQTRPQAVRRVPYPVPPPPPTSVNDVPRILAPDSDTASCAPSQLQSQSQTQSNPCFTQEDKCDESLVQSFLFTQVDGYEGDQSMVDQPSEVADESYLNGLFTLREGEDVDVDEKVNDQDQGADENRGNSSHNENSDSVVPDSQVDQLDDDDAQIAKSLFGECQPQVADHSIAAANAKSVVEASVETELPFFTSVHHDRDKNSSQSQGGDVRSSGVNDTTESVAEHNPDAWKIPVFMRKTNKSKGKAKANSLNVLEQTNKTCLQENSTPVSNGVTRIAREVQESSDRSRPVSAKDNGPKPIHRASGSGHTTTSKPYIIPEIDLRAISRKRSRSFGLNDNIEGRCAKKKRKMRDTLSIELEPVSGAIGHQKFEVRDSSKGGWYSVETSKMTVSVEAKMKLKEFARSFGQRRPNAPSSAQYNPEEPPWIGWPKLKDILLQTGRHRDKQAKG